MVRLGMLASSAVLLVGVARAAADPIQITSGSLVFPAPATSIAVNLVGDGFTFSGSTGLRELLFPYQQCLVPACVAGSTLDLHTFGSEATLSFVTVTYQGQTFENFAGINARSGFLIEWIGALPFPADFTGGTLSAPFSFVGNFRLTDDETGAFERVDLFGSGTATLTFGPYGSPEHPNAFGTKAVRFDFADVAPTPEPASLLLLGTGLCGIAAARRRARSARRSPRTSQSVSTPADHP